MANDESSVSMTASSTTQRIQIYAPKSEFVSEFLRNKYEREAAKYWDIFYKNNANKFFKDRHYLHNEWGDILLPLEDTQSSGQLAEDDKVRGCSGALSGSRVFLELGCGAGNTVYPLLEKDPSAFVYACDFSSRAISLVQAHKGYSQGRVKAFQSDITADDLVPTVPAGSVDAATMIFVLSAIAPEKMPAVIENVKKTLKPGGYVLVRDYADGDLAQERLGNKEQKLSPGFYVRGDGTRAFYFSEDALCQLFRDGGFEVQDAHVHTRAISNRARDLVMNRRWVQGTFRLPPGDKWQAPRLPVVALESGCCANGMPGVIETQVSAQEYHDASSHQPASKETEDREVSLAEHVQPEGCRKGRPSPGAESAVSGESSTSTGQLRDLQPGGPALEQQGEALEDDDVAFSDGVAAQLFGAEVVLEERHLHIGPGLTVSAKCLPPENQHTQASTGLLVWESSQILGSLVINHTELVEGRAVLELGCGGGALPALAATAGSARSVVATDGDCAAMALLEENLEINRGSISHLDRFTCCQLRWGNPEDVAFVRGALAAMDTELETIGSSRDRAMMTQSASPRGGFDVILGADVVYVAEAVPLLFQTAALLLAPSLGSSDGALAEPGGALRESMLLLCHIRRNVGEDVILAAAKSSGFCLNQDLLLQRLGQQLGPDLVDKFANVGSGKGPFRLLCFSLELLP